VFAKAFCFADSAYVIVGGSSPERGSLEIYHLTSSLGEVDGYHRLSYSLSLANEDMRTIRIHSLTPIPGHEIKDRVVSETLTLVEKSLGPGERGFRMFSF